MFLTVSTLGTLTALDDRSLPAACLGDLSDVNPWLDESASYWKSSTPCASITHPVGDGF
jgi:hypothetical protein